MKILRRLLYLAAALAAVFVTYWYGYRQKPTAAAEQERPVPVEVQAVATGSIERTIELTGWIQASHVVHIASKVGGRVESLHVLRGADVTVAVEEGLAVGKGEQIAVIDHEIYLARVAAAAASLEAREVEVKDAEREKDRMSALYQGGSATAQNRDKAVTAFELATASLSLAKANLDLARIDLRESTIVAAIDGVVTTKYIEEGSLITPGQRIVTLADTSTVKIIVALPEKHALEVAKGTPARIRLDALGEREFESSVYSIHPTLDEQTHTIPVEIRVSDESMLLKPGMFARVALVTRRVDDTIVVPRDVILGGKIDEPYVYLVENSGEKEKARKQVVELGLIHGDQYEVTAGLKAGQRLVVNGMTFLADGVSVQIVKLEDIK